MNSSSSHLARLQQKLKDFRLDMLWRSPAWIGSLGERRSPLGLPMLLVGIAVWMIRRSYDGIRHDGMFYAGQTMVRLGDPNVAQDLFFRYGSQDQYTIYSPVMAFLVREFGWVGASMGSVIVSQVAFIVAATLLLLEFAPLALVGLGIAFCAVSPFYGPYNIFSLGEPFTTSRSLAEPLLLFAILAMLKNRYLVCLLLMGLATAMHPLLAAPVWFVLFCLTWMEKPERRRLLAGAVCIGLVLFAIAAYLQPTFFFSTFDSTWWGAFAQHTSQVRLQGWDYHGWELIAFDLGVPLLLARQLSGRNAVFLQLSALALTLGLLVTAWGAELMRSVFLTEIQIWRAAELAHLLAAGLFPFLIWKLRGNGITAVLGSLFVLISFDYFSYDSAAVGVVLGVGLLWLGNRVPHPTKSMQLMVLIFVVVGLGLGLYNQLNLIGYGVAHQSAVNFALTVRAYTATWMFAAALILAVGIFAYRMPRGALALSVVLVIGCSFMWDNRTPFQKYMENSIGQASPLGDYIPPGASVYWTDDLRMIWFILDRPSYFSRNQAAGLVFKRETAMAFLEHEENSLPLKSSSDVCEAIERMGSSCGISPDSVHDVCKPGNADFVILSRRVDDMLPNRTFKVTLDGAPAQSYDVYNCRALIDHKTEHPKSRFLRNLAGNTPVPNAAVSSSPSTSNASVLTGVAPVKAASTS